MIDDDQRCAPRELACTECQGPLRTIPDHGKARCDMCGITYTVGGMGSRPGVRPSGAVKAQVGVRVVSAAASPESLVKRARLMCEDGEFERVADVIERALDLDVEYAEIYVVSLMARHRCSIEADLGALPVRDLSNAPEYVKALRFGDKGVCSRLATYASESRDLAETEGLEDFLHSVAWDGVRALTEQERNELKRAAEELAAARGRAEEAAHEARERAAEAAQRAREEAQAAERAERREATLRQRAAEILAGLDQRSPYPVVPWFPLIVHPSEDRVLILSEDIVARRSWHSSWGTMGVVSWSDSDLRRWLNGDFFESLPAALKSRIVPIDHALEAQGLRKGREDPPHRDDALHLDYVFVLDNAEYDACSRARRELELRLDWPFYDWHPTRGNSMSVAKHLWEEWTELEGHNFEQRAWWLRSTLPGSGEGRDQRVAAVGTTGEPYRLKYMGDPHVKWGGAVYERLGVRPAFWMDLADSTPTYANAKSIAPEAESNEDTQASQTWSPLVAAARRYCADWRFSDHQRRMRWESGDELSIEYAEGLARLALALDPTDGEAYVALLMAKEQCPTEEDLGNLLQDDLAGRPDFRSAVANSTPQLRSRLHGYGRQTRENVELLPQRKTTAARIESSLNPVSIDAGLETRLAELTQRRAELEAARDDSLSKKRQAASMLQSLGVFAGRKKKELESEIARLTEVHEHAQSALVDTETEISTLDARLEDLRRARISWQVVHIDEPGRRALVTASASVAQLPFRDDVAWDERLDAQGRPTGTRSLAAADTSWETSSIRRWLNGEFYRELADHIRERVVATPNETREGFKNPTDRLTTDNVFLLSRGEALTHSNLSGAPLAPQGVSRYWLRSSAGSSAHIVGGLNHIDDQAVVDALDVRPFMWISL